MLTEVLRRLSQNPHALFSHDELAGRPGFHEFETAGLLKAVGDETRVTGSVFRDGRMLAFERLADGDVSIFDPEDFDYPESIAPAEIVRQYQIDQLRLARRIAAHNAIDLSVAEIGPRLIYLGKGAQSVGVSLGWFSSLDLAARELAAVPSLFPSDLSGHVVVCPGLELPPPVRKGLETTRLVTCDLDPVTLDLLPALHVLVSRLAAPTDISGRDPTSGLRWSAGFHTVLSKGKRYDFTTAPAAVVEKLYEAWANGTPFVHQTRLIDLAGSGAKELRDLFRDHEAWGTLVVPGPTRGTFGLDP